MKAVKKYEQMLRQNGNRMLSPISPIFNLSRGLPKSNELNFSVKCGQLDTPTVFSFNSPEYGLKNSFLPL